MTGSAPDMNEQKVIKTDNGKPNGFLKGKTARRISILLFWCLLFLALFAAVRLTERKDGRRMHESFFQEAQAGRIDVLIVGSSHVINGILPSKMYEDYGIASYNFGVRGSRPQITYWILKNALDYVKPKVVLIDTYYCTADYHYLDVPAENYDEEESSFVLSYFHDGIDPFPLRKNKIDAVRDLIQDKDLRKEYYFDFIKYHSRWSSLDSGDVLALMNKGGNMYLGADPVFKINSLAYNYPLLPPTEKLTEKTEGIIYLEKALDLCLERGIRPVLIQVPYSESEDDQRASNLVGSIAEEKGIPFWNMQYVPDLINHDSDLCSQTHLSAYGAWKVSHYLGSLLATYGMPDHRGEPGYERWENSVSAFRDEVRMSVTDQRDVYSTLMLLQFPEYRSVIYVNHGAWILNDRFALAQLADLAGVRRGRLYTDSGQVSDRQDIPDSEWQLDYQDSLLIVRDGPQQKPLAFLGFTEGFLDAPFLTGTENETMLHYLSTRNWSSLEMEENGTVPEEKAENLLSYYERSNVDVQILVFDNETGEFLGEVTY